MLCKQPEVLCVRGGVFGPPGAARHVTAWAICPVGVPDVALERVGVSNRSRKFSGTILFREWFLGVMTNRSRKFSGTILFRESLGGMTNRSRKFSGTILFREII
jgi:hypothetical protein